MLKSSKIKPFLWFDTEAEEAARFYTSVFRSSRMGRVLRNPEGGPRPAGMVLTVEFELEGQHYYWEKLTAGGKPVMCGWLEDRYGVSWQIVPKGMDEYFSDKDPKRAERMMRAIHTMVKLDVAKLEAAAR